MARLKSQTDDREFDSKVNWEPLEISQHWRTVTELTSPRGHLLIWALGNPIIKLLQ